MIGRQGRQRWSALIATSLCCGLAYAEVDYTLVSELEIGIGTANGESIQRSLELLPRLEWTATPQWRLVTELRARLDVADELDAGQVPEQNYASGSQPLVLGDIGALEIRDLYVERVWQRGLLRIGKQQIVWGRLDGLKVLDVINPQDFREFVLADFGESRLPLWSAYADLSLGAWRVELAAIPDSTGHAIPAPRSWFNLAAPRFRFGADSAAPSLPTNTDRGQPSVANGALGMRLSRRVGAVEFSTLAYTGLDHEPLGRLSAVGAEQRLERFYARRHVYGLSAETAIGKLAFRAEASLQSGRTFNTRTVAGLATHELDQFTGGIGVDIDGPFGTFVNLQHVQDHVRDAPPGLVRPGVDRITTVFLRRRFAYDTFEVAARWYYSHELRDRMASVRAAYNVSDRTRIGVEFDDFSGDSAGLFGQFAGRDRLTFSLRHTF